MLTQVIQSATQVAQSAAQLPAPPGAAQTAQADVKAFLAQSVPALQNLQKVVSQFAATSSLNVTGILDALNQGAAASSLVGRVQALGQEAGPVAGVVSGASTLAGQNRDRFSSDSAALTNQAAVLQSQAAGLIADRDQKAAAAESLRKRIQIINALSFINPLIKLFDELASLIQSSKSTEAQLADDNQKVAQIQAQMSQLSAMAQQVGSLNAGTSQLAGAVQSVANVFNMVNSQLKNDQQFAGATDAATAALYVRALQSNLQNLVQLAQ